MEQSDSMNLFCFYPRLVPLPLSRFHHPAFPFIVLFQFVLVSPCPCAFIVPVQCVSFYRTLWLRYVWPIQCHFLFLFLVGLAYVSFCTTVPHLKLYPAILCLEYFVGTGLQTLEVNYLFFNYFSTFHTRTIGLI